MFPRGFPFHSSEPVLLPIPARMNALSHYTGDGVTIAFIDSGFYPHPDLGGRVLVHVDATTESIREGSRFRHPMWYSWHGQMTSVIACGNGHNSNGRYRGIASSAQLVLIKVSTQKKQLKEHDILRGMEWLLKNHQRFNVRVLNLSVGGDNATDDPNHVLFQATDALIAAGITVIVAGGNNPTAPIVPPNSAPNAITVGGYDDQNSLDVADWKLYSNAYGVAVDGSLKPDILAPANWLPSPVLPKTIVERQMQWLTPLLDLSPDDEQKLTALLKQGARDLELTQEEIDQPTQELKDKLLAKIREYKIVDSQHQYVSGTSVSTAIISSVVAQMLQANPRLTPPIIKAILIKTAKQLPDTPIEQQGAGVVDATAAVKVANEFIVPL